MLHNGALLQNYGWVAPEPHDGLPGGPRILCYMHGLERGGAERAAVRLLRAWCPHAQVTVALVEGDAGTLPADGARIVRPGWAVPAWLATLWMLAWLPFVIRRERPDTLFCPGNSYSLAAVVARLVLGKGCPPIVVKVSNPLDRADLPPAGRLVAGWWARIQALVVDRFVGTSAAMVDEIIAVTGVAPAQVTLIANPAFDRASHAVLSAIPPRVAVPGEGRHFLAVGRLVAQKDFPTLLRAFAMAARADDRLTILGEGPERTALLRLAERLGVADRVRLAGFERNVAPWLESADALLLSSRYEGMPAVVLEALAAGRPVIATDCCVAMAPLLGEGRRGVLVPPADAAALAQAIATLDPATFDAADARAVAAHYVTDRVAAAYLPLFRVAGTSGGAPVATLRSATAPLQ